MTPEEKRKLALAINLTWFVLCCVFFNSYCVLVALGLVPPRPPGHVIGALCAIVIPFASLGFALLLSIKHPSMSKVMSLD